MLVLLLELQWGKGGALCEPQGRYGVNPDRIAVTKSNQNHNHYSQKHMGEKLEMNLNIINKSE